MSALIAMLAFMSIIFLVAGIQRYTAPGVKVYLARFSMRGEASTSKDSYFERRIRPIIKKLGPRFTFLRSFMDEEAVERKLVYAGNPLRLDAEQFFGLKILSSIVALCVGVYFFYLGVCFAPLLLVASPVVGFLWPDWWLNGQVKKRQTQITLDLPDMLDLLSVCVQAGMGFDAALANISQNMVGPLSEEIARFLREIEMGEPRAEALNRLAERNSAEDLRTFVGALIQAESLGVPIAHALRIQADEMRTRRSQRAKELAAKASPQISLVTILIVAPSAVFLLIAALVIGMVFGSNTIILGGRGILPPPP